MYRLQICFSCQTNQIVRWFASASGFYLWKKIEVYNRNHKQKGWSYQSCQSFFKWRNLKFVDTCGSVKVSLLTAAVDLKTKPGVHDDAFRLTRCCTKNVCLYGECEYGFHRKGHHGVNARTVNQHCILAWHGQVQLQLWKWGLHNGSVVTSLCLLLPVYALLIYYIK